MGWGSEICEPYVKKGIFILQILLVLSILYLVMLLSDSLLPFVKNLGTLMDIWSFETGQLK